MADKATEEHCSGSLGRIYEYLDGALSCEDLNDLNNHLAHCEHCAREYDLECVIRSVIKRSCRESAPEDLKSKIWQRIDDIRASQHTGDDIAV